MMETEFLVNKALVLDKREYKPKDEIQLTDKQAVFLELSGKVSRNKPQTKKPGETK